jgi:hypothetical protein
VIPRKNEVVQVQGLTAGISSATLAHTFTQITSASLSKSCRASVLCTVSRKTLRAYFGCKAKNIPRECDMQHKRFHERNGAVKQKYSASECEPRSETFHERIWAAKQKIPQANLSVEAKDAASEFELHSEAKVPPANSSCQARNCVN